MRSSSDSVQAATVWDYGPGEVSCGTWLAERSKGDKGTWTTLGQWVLGWVSAAGWYGHGYDLRHTDSDAISAWVDNYCREHPLNKIHEAGESLVVELSKPK